MKHLLAALAARKIPLDATEGDIKLLLAQAQRFRGDTKSVESWEDTLEKILVELRTTDYATAFLKPVKKSEAWDYDRGRIDSRKVVRAIPTPFQPGDRERSPKMLVLTSCTVITHPMDLQTMGRKVKSKAYLTKKAFADDLNLIWDNCLTYNSDPNHPLRRAAHYMRKKADQILRRIPDRHERFAPSMIDRFKYSPSPSPFLSPGLPNKHRLLNGILTPTTDESKPLLLQENGANTNTGSGQSIDGDAVVDEVGAKNALLGLVPTEPQTTIHAGVTDIPFEDRPALERSAEGMAAFVGFDAAMDEFLESWDPFAGPDAAAGPSTDAGGGGSNMELSDARPQSSSMLGAGLPILDVNTRLRQLADEDDELAVWKIVMEDLPEPSQAEPVLPESDRAGSAESGSDATKKRKRGEDLFVPRKRRRLEKIPAPERNPLENWWFAVGSTALLANAVPQSVSSLPMSNPRLARLRTSRLLRDQPADAQNPADNVPKQARSPRRKRQPQGSGRPALFQLMSENVRTRKRARDIAIKIADQIEDEKQGVDPEDLAPLVPVDAITSIPLRKPWSRRAALASRRRMEVWEDTVGPAEAQDCMESTAMLILEHANFDSSSAAALQVLGDIGGRCIQNLGRSLKILNETHHGKMTAEEMVLHALFSNSIGSIYELEAYIKSDIIKHGVSLSNMLQTLEEVALKREEPVDEDAILKDENEVMYGLGDLGEDIYGFRELGLDTEFGLKSLVVPKRLLRPKAKTTSNSEAAAQVDKYPPPPPFAPLETKRIDEQIGLLRPYYHQRVAALIPPPMPIPPPPAIPLRPVTPPVVAAKSPTPEPPLSVPEVANVPAPAPPPAPVFDPYNPSALSIVVPKSTTPTPAPKPEPTPPKAAAAEPAPVTPLLQPTAVNVHPNLPNINTGPYPADMRPLMEKPTVLEDDAPDPSRVKVGPLGQIMMPSAATVAKQKRQHKAAQAKAAAAAAAAAAVSTSMPPATPTSTALQSPVSATKPKKSTPKKPKKLEVATVG